MPKITKRSVDALKPGKFLWDDEIRGFGVRCRPSADPENKGRRYYVLKFRAAGQQRWITIGEHGSPWTPDDARTKALALLAAVKVEGADPAAVRDADKRAMTVEQLCRNYLAAAEKGLVHGKRKLPKKASTLATDRGRIERHIIPLLGKRRVKDLSRKDIQQFHNDVAAGKTAAVVKTKKRGKAVVEGGAGTAARTLGLLGGILTFAIQHEGIISENPARGAERRADNRRTVHLSSEQYRELGKALAALKAENETPQVLDAVWLLALTGCRRGEIEALRWSEVDEAGRALRLADTKEGESVRPAGTAVFDVLKGVERKEKVPFVLVADRGEDHFKGLPKGFKRVVERAKLPKVTPHTLRHSFASVANELGYTEPTIAAMLGHASGSITGRYIHHLDAALTSGADRVAKHIRAYMTGETATVSSFDRGRVTA
jgi:integrase